MTISFVVSTKANSGANGSTSPGINTTAANFIIISRHNDSQTGQSPTDNQGNTYSALLEQNSGAASVYGRLYYVTSPTVSASHTFSIADTGHFPGIFVSAYSGVSPAGLDQQNGFGTKTSGDTIQPGSITPTTNNQLVVTGLVQIGTAPSVNSSFTIRESDAFAAGANYGGGIADIIQGTAAATNPTWSWSSHTLLDRVTMIVSFQATTTSSGSTLPMMGV